MSDTINYCVSCEKSFANKINLSNHEGTIRHKKILERKRLLKIVNDDEFDFLELKDINSNVIDRVQVDKAVYQHILTNNYPVLYSDGYALIHHGGKTEFLHRYIYYIFYKKEVDPTKPLID